MAICFVLTLFSLYLSRLREYYTLTDTAPRFVVDNGAEKLQRGLLGSFLITIDFLRKLSNFGTKPSSIIGFA